MRLWIRTGERCFGAGNMSPLFEIELLCVSGFGEKGEWTGFP
jgi:hypothetical protein